MRILVTGGHGFVGTELTKRLKEAYKEAEILTPTSAELNLLDQTMTETFMRREKADVVFHLAARLGGVGIVSNRPLEFLETNLQINYNIAHAARKAGVKKFITLGSSCSYSDRTPLPNTETDLWNGHPENTYGICKLVLLEQLTNQNEMDWAYLIPPNIYGSGDHFGEENAHFIPATVMKFRDAVREHQESIEVWGDGMQTRDFVYVDDIVHFLICALEEEKYRRAPLNISTGIETTIKEVVECIRDELGLSEKIRIDWAPNMPTGTKRKALSNERLLSLTPGYRFTELREGLKRTLCEVRV